MRFDLDGVWEIKDDEGEFKFRGNVPGTVQGDLVELGLLPHPYVGTNEKIFRRLEGKSWTYMKKFTIDKIEDALHYDLVFKGIDTLSKVYLNGKFVGSTDDMFLEYRFNVKGILKKGANILEVRIASPIGIPRTLEKNYGKLSASDESSRPYIRKAQYSYGWDWGARIVTSGIWRNVYIESYPDARLFGCTAYLEDLDVLNFAGYVENVDEERIDSYKMGVFANAKKIAELPVALGPRGAYFEGKVKRGSLKLWFPNGTGESVLHDFEFKLSKDGKIVYNVRKKIGLRTVKIVKEKDDEGETFIFEINGKKIFSKGANWIPADNVLSWIKRSDYDKLLSMVKSSNMNMLRVWGGGIYEDDHFYSKCDELGIMVWQDFMFACAQYPDHLDWFRRLANKEVRQIVVKLRYHPSIVLWCGNNENNWGFYEWKDFARKINGEFLGNKLYLQDFPKICAEEDPSRTYWPSSPYGGSTPNSQEAGDVHVWNVWSGWADYKSYLNNKGKFISEFGFQSAPHMKTIDFFAKPEEKRIFSEVMLSHNKQIEGPERIMKFINTKFGLVRDFESIRYLSQVNQAEAMKLGVEHWRSRKYKTGGTIYWQLNDSWPVFSWSAIDYFKRPKALYYYTKRFYSQILPLIKSKNGRIEVNVVNDTTSQIANLEVEIWSFKEGNILRKEYDNVRIQGDSVTYVDIFDVDSHMLSQSIAFVRLYLDKKVVENFEMFADLRRTKLPNPKISYELNNGTLKLKCEKPAYAVFVRTKMGTSLSDNYFSMSPSTEKTVEDVPNDFKILTMYDYQNF